MTVGVAILGGGNFAREQHKPAVLASPDLSLLAVYSRSLASAQSIVSDLAEAERGRITLYSDDGGASGSLEALLARSDIAGVIIALPIPVQPAVIRRCLAAGKHVLSEKPIAPDVATALDLLSFYRTTIAGKGGPTWSVAENQRFLTNFQHAAAAVGERGRPLTFRARIVNLLPPGDRLTENAWRKSPAYQGGFVLDGGVHYTAGLRLLLSGSGSGSASEISELSAFSAQLQPHLPPLDTVVATARTAGGAVGTVSISFGATEQPATEWVVGSEKGWVAVREDDRFEVDGQTRHVDADGGGVQREVRAWGALLATGSGQPDASLLRPEQALADLELVEAMLKSAEDGARVVKLQHQHVPPIL